MDDKTLKRMAVVCSLIGLLILFFISQKMEVPEKMIDELTSEDVTRTVKIVGYVDSYNNKGNFNTLKISQISTIDVISFDDISNISKGEGVQAIGEYREVKGKKELILDELKKSRYQICNMS